MLISYRMFVGFIQFFLFIPFPHSFYNIKWIIAIMTQSYESYL